MSETADRAKETADLAAKAHRAGGQRGGVTSLLWTRMVIYVVLTLVNPVIPNHIPVPIPILVRMPFVFAVLHAAQRYITFLVICLAARPAAVPIHKRWR